MAAAKRKVTVKDTKEQKAQVVKSEVKATSAKKKLVSMKTEVIDTKGKVAGSVTLPESLFGAPINETLMAQAVRVYLANQRQGTVSTKSRGEVQGSTRKIYRQKGTGRARHGGVRAPLFVGGGVAFGPKPRDYSLSMPKKMRQRALASALSAKYQNGDVTIIAGLEKLEAKTKEFVAVLRSLHLDNERKKVLLVLPEKTETLQRAVRNVEGVTFVLANQLNTYEILNAKNLLFMQSALDVAEKTFGKGENN